MFGFFAVYLCFAIVCVQAIFRPWVGIVGFYGFALLVPQWNWRWSLPQDFEFQKYIIACTLVGFVLNGFPGQQIRGHLKLAYASLLTFLVLAFVSGMQTIDKQLSDFYLGIMWKIVLTSLLAIRLLDSPAKIRTFMWVVVLANGYNGYGLTRDYLEVGYCDYVMHPWAFQSSNQLSNLFVCCSAVSLALLFYETKTWRKAVIGLILLLQVHAVMLLESRGCMLGLLTMATATVWLMPKTKTNLHLVFAAIVGAAILAGPPVVKEFISIFADKENRDASAESRVDLWRAGYEITLDHPLLGVGPDAGQRLVPAYYSAASTSQTKALHNLFFEISTGCGLPAAIAFFMFFVTAGIASQRMTRDKRGSLSLPPGVQAGMLASTAGLIGFMTANLFSSGALLEGSYTLAIIGCATVAIAKGMLQPDPLGPPLADLN